MAKPLSKKARKAAAKPRRQSAALPWRRTDEGAVEVLLITSRETRRWVVPKGWPMTGLTLAAGAAQEALEEAGVRGHIQTEALGSYAYDKRLKTGRLQPVVVEVFALAVTKERKNWREKSQRAKQWLSPAAAAQLVDEPDLAALIAAFSPPGPAGG